MEQLSETKKKKIKNGIEWKKTFIAPTLAKFAQLQQQNCEVQKDLKLYKKKKIGQKINTYIWYEWKRQRR